MATSKTSTNTEASKPDSKSNTDVEKCSICSVHPASDQIVKDHNFQKMMKLYFEMLELDIKPAELAKQDICTTCFEVLVEFYDTNDILVVFENEIRKSKLRIINTIEKGIEGLNKEGKSLSSIQKGVREGLPIVKAKLKIALIKQEPNAESDALIETLTKEDYTFRTYLKPASQANGKSKNANAESSDNYESTDTSKPNEAESASKRKRDASSEASDSQQSPEKVQPTRRLPARNKSKAPRYNIDSDDNSGSDDDDKVPAEHGCTTCKKVFGKYSELTEHKKSCTGNLGRGRTRK